METWDVQDVACTEYQGATCINRNSYSAKTQSPRALDAQTPVRITGVFYACQKNIQITKFSRYEFSYMITPN
ncbi:MAG: hypothetical protein OEZ38_09505 [Gammaproteobacteria bacterium]|nr:hypothetical protein [Gammaproteobacteria bacterium]